MFPIHPRKENRIQAYGLSVWVSAPSFLVLPPLGYKDALCMIKSATLVLTDSGGIAGRSVFSPCSLFNPSIDH
ncbi:UDP-N-acetylglucosamine 2-epimerase [Pajaroellobacter abortibovis]|uniref:UDP-N-acetylglucosamine 2-epimerase n=1 Tax=Pajaroellobacter abortibovis TaxID=1882918 RepID=UPI0012EC3D84